VPPTPWIVRDSYDLALARLQKTELRLQHTPDAGAVVGERTAPDAAAIGGEVTAPDAAAVGWRGLVAVEWTGETPDTAAANEGEGAKPNTVIVGGTGVTSNIVAVKEKGVTPDSANNRGNAEAAVGNKASARIF
jgi:hypothetical protein